MFKKRNKDNENNIINQENELKDNVEKSEDKKKNKKDFVKPLIIALVIIVIYLIGNIFEFLNNKKGTCNNSDSSNNSSSISLVNRKKLEVEDLENDWEYVYYFSPEDMNYYYGLEDNPLYTSESEHNFYAHFPNLIYSNGAISLDSTNSSITPYINIKGLSRELELKIIVNMPLSNGVGNFTFYGIGYKEDGTLNTYQDFSVTLTRIVHDNQGGYSYTFSNKCGTQFNSNGYYDGFKVQFKTISSYTINNITICVGRYTEHYQDGYSDGFTDGRENGYNNGFTEGQENGYNNGFTEGQENGYNNGYDVGKTDGYDKGYIDGRVFGEKNNIGFSISTILNGIYASVFSLFLNIGSFEFYGFKLIDLFTFAVLIYMVYLIIKIFKR